MKKLTSTIAIALLATTVFFNANAEDKKSDKSNTTSTLADYKVSRLNIGLYEAKYVNSMKLNVTLTKDEGKTAIIKLMDINGNILDEQIVGKKAKGFNLRYDFNGMEAGKYYIEITNGANILTKEIIKTTATLSY